MQSTTTPRNGQSAHGRSGSAAKLGFVPIQQIPRVSIRPAPENNQLYRPVDPDDPDIQALADSILLHGVKESLVISEDRFILSGHRRHCAAGVAGLELVPCRFEPIRRDRDPDRFLVLLREYNRQRIKSLDEVLREEVVSADPEESYQSLIDFRSGASKINVRTLDIPEAKRRAAISPAKQPFLIAVKSIVTGLRRYWPLSDRRIHYCLLNAPPLIHASKPHSTYTNTPQCYKSLTDLLTRARLAGEIPMDCIADETRPVETWNVHRNPQAFLRGELDGFLKNYWRDLMQSQPNHVEIVGEKITVGPVLSPVAGQYCIPMTLGRGFCSLPPRAKMAERFIASGKERLILLVVSDFDPAGEQIAESFARSMRDEFGMKRIDAIKVALTADQVARRDLPPGGKAKGDKHGEYTGIARKFVEKYGDNVFELEALAPEALQGILRETIDSVIDLDAFNHEIAQEKQDAAFLNEVRQRASLALADIADEGEAN